MPTYILIHGAWHGSWCWDKVVPLLKLSGHQVEAPDLPGSGDITLEAYTERVVGVLDACSEPVFLVGHSLGGLTISQVAEARPERIQMLIYLAAALIPSGESLLSLSAQLTPSSSFSPHLIIDWEQRSSMINPSSLEEFYSGCSEADIAHARPLLVPQAMSVYGTPLVLSPERFGKVSKAYITCQRDPVIYPFLQKEMYSLTPCQKIFSLETGHFPFFSAPEELVQILLSLAE